MGTPAHDALLFVFLLMAGTTAEGEVEAMPQEPTLLSGASCRRTSTATVASPRSRLCCPPARPRWTQGHTASRSLCRRCLPARPRAPDDLGHHGARLVNRVGPRSRNNLIAAAGVGGVGKQSRLEEEEATNRRGTIVWPGHLNRCNERAIQTSN
jgi:hypothetical protein